MVVCQLAEARVVDKVAGVQVMVCQLAEARVVGQVAGVQVVVGHVAEARVVDQVAGVQVVEQDVMGEQRLAGSTDVEVRALPRGPAARPFSQ